MKPKKILGGNLNFKKHSQIKLNIKFYPSIFIISIKTKKKNVFVPLLSFVEKCELFYEDRRRINDSTFLSRGLHLIHFPSSR